MKQIYLITFLLASQFTFSQYKFLPQPDPSAFPERTSATIISADIPYQGYDEMQAYYGKGEYEIFIDTYNGILNKPIIILDGFDPGDGRGIADIYASLGYEGQNLANVLRAEGFDIVVLNAPQYNIGGKFIDGGSDYIQRNAMVLIKLIQQLNAQKSGNEPLVILGPSMGGLIARYALAYMEQNNLPSDTRLYISLDSPHRGANIPISVQYLINYFAQEVGDISAQQVVDQLLNSPAAKQMLVDHLLAHLAAGSAYEQDPAKLLPAGAPGFRDEFQAELDNLGFPTSVRNITVINGSGNGINIGSPGITVVDTNLSIDWATSIDVESRFTPAASQTNIVTNVVTKFLGIPISTYTAKSTSPSYTDGVDSAPVGTGSISDALGDGGGNQIMIDFLNALQQDLYSFIPTLSSLAINESNWFAIPNENDSPFDAFYIPVQNEPHVALNAESLQFILDEIRGGVVGLEDAKVNNGIVLGRNPVIATIELIVATDKFFSEKLFAAVYNVAGKRLMENSWTIDSSKIEWHHNLKQGIYFLRVNVGSYVKTYKFVVE